MANTCFDAIHKIGMPEARIILSECCIYLATSPKSNSAYEAIGSAISQVRELGDLPVPLHLRNAPTKLMKQLGYGNDYKYAHSYEGNFAEQDFLPKKIRNQKFYEPQKNPQEETIRARLVTWWKKKYGY
jgi:putative ATPase